jgi:hypothetical protein
MIVQQFWTSPALRWVLWTAGIIVVALAASFLAPPLVALLREARAEFAALRTRASTWAERVTSGRWAAFWDRSCHEPLEPVLAGLARIDETARTMGTEEVATLQRLDAHLSEQMRLLRAAAAPNPIPTASDRARVTRVIAAGGFGSLLGLALLALALGGINAALLSVFFREFIGVRSPIPTLFPELQMGHVLAVLFFVLEVASGWLIHRYGPEERDDVEDGPPRTRSFATHFFFVASWGLLVSLALIELIAYAVLSDRLNIPAQLRIASDSPFYGLTRFFFAGFGLALTAALAGIGHAAAETMQKMRHARVERRLLRALERRDDLVASNVERVRRDVTAIRDAATGLPDNVAQSFHERLGLRHRYPGVPLALYAATVQSVVSTEPSTVAAFVPPDFVRPPAPPVRTWPQVMADLCVQLAILAVLLIVSILTAMETVAWLGSRTLPLANGLAWAAGIFLPAAAIGIGLATRGALARLRYATPVEQILGERRGKRWFGLVVAALAVITAVVLALLAIEVRVLGGGVVLNALLGVLQAGVLITLGSFFDSGLVALVHVFYFALLGAAWLIAFVLIAVGHVASAICAVVEFVLRVLAVPGNLIRSMFTKTLPKTAPLTNPQ